MIIILNIILVIAIILIAAKLIRYGEKQWWKKFNNSPHNFSFRWHGRTLWYSRACAIAVFVFCKNSLGEWCVLANQRGKGAPDYNFFWNGICGYVDHNETCEQAAIRELQEETGLNLPIEQLKFSCVNSDPCSNKQNITIRYFIKIDDMTTSNECLEPKITEEGEKDEVAAVAWIPVNSLNEYNWAFGHKEIIEEMVLNNLS